MTRLQPASGFDELTTGWSVTGGYEHHWNPAWKTSLYGAYGSVNYSDCGQRAYCRSVNWWRGLVDYAAWLAYRSGRRSRTSI